MMQNTLSSGRRRGFTVVELGILVVVGGTTAGVFAPSGGRFVQSNTATRSQWVHHSLAQRQAVYIENNNGDFTGPNTSGEPWNKYLVHSSSGNGIETLEFDTAGGNPTSQGDWITPLVGDEYGFSPNRAIRTRQKFSYVWDPTADRMVDSVYKGGSLPEDLDQFDTVLNTRGFKQRSFLQVRSFTNYSNEQPRSNVVRDTKNGIVYFEMFAVQHPYDIALSPEGYSPKLWNVGTQLSNKVMFADGTRYYSIVSGLDFSIATVEGGGLGGESDDADPGPIYHGSAAYGRQSSHSPKQGNLELSYRKGGGEGLYVTMFDGSLQYMTREETWTDPTPWYPSGSVWQGNEATPESEAWVQKNLPGGIIH